MAYCNKCGNFVADGEQFCGNCGARVDGIPTDAQSQQVAYSSSQRSTVYDGAIHKCPNCGATLDAFVTCCPDCGYELRGGSVKEFSQSYASATSDSQKIDLIRTFVIPNTKEDIWEFVILASSNINSSSYSSNSSEGISDKALADAWMTKFEQAHQKANLMLKDDPYLEKINELYSSKKKAIGIARTKTVGNKVLDGILGNKIALISIASAIVTIILIIVIAIVSGAPERKLKKQVKEVERYISEEKYDDALTVAYAMSDNRSSNWSETRKNLIDRINNLKAAKKIEEARSKGLIQIPAQTLVGKQASDVVSILSSAGFTNITQESVKNDSIKGWVNKITKEKGTVAEVSINGDTEFKPGTWVSKDAPVILRVYDK